MSQSNKLGNPAVVGLAGFGMTTLLLQLHNLGLVPHLAGIIALGLFFGGLAQFIAGLMEFKTGNNFGFCAFTAYGAFWMGTVVLWFLNKYSPDFVCTEREVGYYLIVWGIFTLLMFFEAIRHHTVGALIFLTLTLGFLGLGIGHILGAHAGLGKTILMISAIDLIICAFLAWYNMIQIIYTDSGVKLPLGKAWMTVKS